MHKTSKNTPKRVKKRPLPPIETPKTSFFTLFQWSKNLQNTQIHENSLKFNRFFNTKIYTQKIYHFFSDFFDDFSVIFSVIFQCFSSDFLVIF